MKPKIHTRDSDSEEHLGLMDYHQLMSDAGLSNSIFEGNRVDRTHSYYRNLLELLLGKQAFSNIHTIVRNIIAEMDAGNVVIVGHEGHAYGIRYTSLTNTNKKSSDIHTMITISNRGMHSGFNCGSKGVEGMGTAEFLRKDRLEPGTSFVIDAKIEDAKNVIQNTLNVNACPYDELMRGTQTNYKVRLLPHILKSEIEEITTTYPHAELIKRRKEKDQRAVSSQRSGTCTSKSMLAAFATYCEEDYQIKVLKMGLKFCAIEKIMPVADHLTQVIKADIATTLRWCEESINDKNYQLSEEQRSALNNLLSEASCRFHSKTSTTDVAYMQMYKYRIASSNSDELIPLHNFAWESHKAITTGFYPMYWLDAMRQIPAKKLNYDKLASHARHTYKDNDYQWLLPPKKDEFYVTNLVSQIKTCISDNALPLAIEPTHRLVEQITTDISFTAPDNIDFINFLLDKEHMFNTLYSSGLLDCSETISRMTKSGDTNEQNSRHLALSIISSLRAIKLICCAIKYSEFYEREHKTLNRKQLLKMLIREYMDDSEKTETSENYKLKLGQLDVSSAVYKLDALHKTLTEKLENVGAEFKNGDSSRETVFSDYNKNLLMGWQLYPTRRAGLEKVDHTNRQIFEKIKEVNEFKEDKFSDTIPKGKLPCETPKELKDSLQPGGKYEIFNKSQLEYINFEETIRSELYRTTCDDHKLFSECTERNPGFKSCQTSTETRDITKTKRERIQGFQIGNRNDISRRMLSVCRVYNWRELSSFIITADLLSSRQTLEDAADSHTTLRHDDIHRYLMTLIAGLPYESDEAYDFADDLMCYIERSDHTKGHIERLILAIKALGCYFDHLITQKTFNNHTRDDDLLERVHTIVARYLSINNPILESSMTLLVQKFLLLTDANTSQTQTSPAFNSLLIYYHYLYAQIAVAKKVTLGYGAYDAIVNNSRKLMAKHTDIDINLLSTSNSEDYLLQTRHWQELFSIPYKRITYRKGSLVLVQEEAEHVINTVNNSFGCINLPSYKIGSFIIEKNSFFSKFNLDRYDITYSADKRWLISNSNCGYTITYDNITSNITVIHNDVEFTVLSLKINNEENLDKSFFKSLLLAKRSQPFYAINNKNGQLFIGDKRRFHFTICDLNQTTSQRYSKKGKIIYITSVTTNMLSPEYPILTTIEDGKLHYRITAFDLTLTSEFELVSLPGYYLNFWSLSYVSFHNSISNQTVYIVKRNFNSLRLENRKNDKDNFVSCAQDDNWFFYHKDNIICDFESGDHLIAYAEFAVVHDIAIDIDHLRRVVTNNLAYTQDGIEMYEKEYMAIMQVPANAKPNDYTIALFILLNMHNYFLVNNQISKFKKVEDANILHGIYGCAEKCINAYLSVESKVDKPLLPEELHTLLLLFNPYSKLLNSMCTGEHGDTGTYKHKIEQISRYNRKEWGEDIMKYNKYLEDREKSISSDPVPEPRWSKYRSSTELPLEYTCGSEERLHKYSWYNFQDNTTTLPKFDASKLKDPVTNIEERLGRLILTNESLNKLPPTSYPVDTYSFMERVKESKALMNSKFEHVEQDISKVRSLLVTDNTFKDEIIRVEKLLKSEIDKMYQELKGYLESKVIRSPIDKYYDHNRVATLATEITEKDSRLAKVYRLTKAEVSGFKQVLYDLVILKTEQQHWQRVIADFAEPKEAATQILAKRAYDITEGNFMQVISYLLIEFNKNIRLKDSQVNLSEAIIAKDNAMVCASIGNGKTTVLPALIHKITLNSDSKNVLLLLPENLIKEQGAEIALNYTSYYRKQAILYTIDPGLKDAGKTLHIYNTILEGQSRVIISTRDSIQGLKNMILMNPNDTVVDEGMKLLKQLSQCVMICDEIDEEFSVTKTIIYSKGNPESIDLDEQEFLLQLIARAALTGIISTDKDDFKYPNSNKEYTDEAEKELEELMVKLLPSETAGIDNLLRLKNLCSVQYLPHTFTMKYDFDWMIDHEAKCAVPLSSGVSKGLHFKDIYLKVVLSIVGYMFYEPEKLIWLGFDHLSKNYSSNDTVGNAEQSELYMKLFGEKKIQAAGLDLSLWKSSCISDQDKERELDKLCVFLMKCENKKSRFMLLSYLLKQLILPNILYPQECLEMTGADFSQLGNVAGVSGTTSRGHFVLKSACSNDAILADGLIIRHISNQASTTVYDEHNLWNLINSKTQLIVDPTQQEASTSIEFAQKFLEKANQVRKQSREVKLQYVLFFYGGKLHALADHKDAEPQPLSHSAYSYLRDSLKCSENQWCAVLDSSHSRGFDIKLPKDAHGLVVVSQHIEYNNFLQAVGRLRKIETQKVTIALTKSFADDLTRKDQANTSHLSQAEVNIGGLLDWLIRKEIESQKQLMQLATQQRERQRNAEKILDFEQKISDYKRQENDRFGFRNIHQNAISKVITTIARSYTSKNDPKAYVPSQLIQTTTVVQRVLVSQKQRDPVKMLKVPDYVLFDENSNEHHIGGDFPDGLECYLSGDMQQQNDMYPYNDTRLQIHAVYRNPNDQFIALTTNDIKHLSEDPKKKGNIIYLMDIMFNKLNASKHKLSKDKNLTVYKKLVSLMPWLLVMGGHFDQNKKTIANMAISSSDMHKDHKCLISWSNITSVEPAHNIMIRKLKPRYTMAQSSAVTIQNTLRNLFLSPSRLAEIIKKANEVSKDMNLPGPYSRKVLAHLLTNKADTAKDARLVTDLKLHTKIASRDSNLVNDKGYMGTLADINKKAMVINRWARNFLARKKLNAAKKSHLEYKSRLVVEPKKLLPWYTKSYNYCIGIYNGIKERVLATLDALYRMLPTKIKMYVYKKFFSSRIPFDGHITVSQLSRLFDALQNNNNGLSSLISKVPRIPSMSEQAMTWLIYMVNKAMSFPSKYILLVKNHMYKLLSWTLKTVPSITANKVKPKPVDKLKPSEYINRHTIRRLNTYIRQPKQTRIQ